MARYRKENAPNEEISPQRFSELLKLSGWMKAEYLAYAVLMYWIGCRRSEPLSLKKQDLTLKNEQLWIKGLPAKKQGKRAETIKLSIDLVGMEIFEFHIGTLKKNDNVFSFSDRTGYNIIKQVFGKYPHWLRYNRVTKIRRLIDRGDISKDEAKAFTGIRSDRTFANYGMVTQEGADKVAGLLKNQ